MSGFMGTCARDIQNWKTSSISNSSDILSTSVLPSSISISNESIHEWVLFSPVESFAREPINDQSDSSDLIDEFGLRSAEQNRHPTFEDSYVSAVSISGLELPSHNGSGSFDLGATEVPMDLFNRVNTWRLDQAKHDIGTKVVAHSRVPSPWQLLKNAAVNAWHSLVDIDDRTIDALMGTPIGQKDLFDLSIVTSPHLYNARQHGPPGWEERMLNYVARNLPAPQNETGLVFAILARVLSWQQRGSTRAGPGPLVEPVNPGHSYHYPEIQRSIASLTASVHTSEYSDSWGTSVSNNSLITA